jgi:hypothetical protein
VVDCAVVITRTVAHVSDDPHRHGRPRRPHFASVNLGRNAESVPRRSALSEHLRLAVAERHLDAVCAGGGRERQPRRRTVRVGANDSSPAAARSSVNQSTGAVTVSTTGSTTLGTVAVRVTALDSCGAAAVTTFNVTVGQHDAGPAGRHCLRADSRDLLAANGAVDPGETVTVSLPINNTGAGPTSSLVATLQNSGGITPTTTSQNYGAIAANGTTSQPFQFVANGTCGGTVTATLQLAGRRYELRLRHLHDPPRRNLDRTLLAENFDSVTAPALPSGWTATSTASSGPSPPRGRRTPLPLLPRRMRSSLHPSRTSAITG